MFDKEVVGSTQVGTIMAVVDMPDPWPPMKPLSLRQDLSDGHMEVEIGVGRRIRAALYRKHDNDEHLIAQAVSCRLFSERDARFVLCVCWNNDITLMAGESTIIGSSNPSKQIERTYRVPRNPVSLNDAYDYSLKNAKAITSRKGKIRPLEVDGIVPPDIQKHMFNSLNDEAEQISDLIRLIHSGKTSHIRGLGGRLRVLLGDANQWPLLQTCAAMRNLPLMVHTITGNPEALKTLFEVDPNADFNSPDISYEPRRLLINPIDLDVWLNRPAIAHSGTLKTNKKLINEIGNTIGNHLDPHTLPSIRSLQGKTLSDQYPKMNFLERYVLVLGEATLALSTYVISSQTQIRI